MPPRSTRSNASRSRLVNGVACIRAVQGHDQRLAAFYNLSDSEMLQLLELPRAPRYAIHGTMLKHYEAIKEGGLCRRQRRHIHFNRRYERG